VSAEGHGRGPEDEGYKPTIAQLALLVPLVIGFLLAPDDSSTGETIGYVAGGFILAGIVLGIGYWLATRGDGTPPPSWQLILWLALLATISSGLSAAGRDEGPDPTDPDFIIHSDTSREDLEEGFTALGDRAEACAAEADPVTFAKDDVITFVPAGPRLAALVDQISGGLESFNDLYEGYSIRVDERYAGLAVILRVGPDTGQDDDVTNGIEAALGPDVEVEKSSVSLPIGEGTVYKAPTGISLVFARTECGSVELFAPDQATAVAAARLLRG
jgi:hypothetical protein